MSITLMPSPLTPEEFRLAIKVSKSTLHRVDHLLPDRRTLTNKRYYLPEDIKTYYQLKDRPDALPDNQSSNSSSVEISDTAECERAQLSV